MPKPSITSGSFLSLVLFFVAISPAAINAQTSAQKVAPTTTEKKTDITEWNQWRGPKRNGVVDGLNWPESFDNLTEKWRVKDLSPSYSGPIVVGDRVFTTQTVDKKMETVLAYDRVSGEKVWEQTWNGAISVPFFAKANGDWIRATPIYDEGRLYVAGIRDVLVCLNAENGDIIWQVDFPAETGSGVPSFGMVCSPMIDGEFLYVQAGGGFCKLNKNDGKIIWTSLKDGGGMNGSAFSSPIIETIAGVRQALVQTRTELVGVDLETGDKLWGEQIKSFRGMNIITPTTYKDSLFVSTYGGTTQLINLKSNGSGTPQASKQWQLKVEGYMTTPVIVGDHAYTHLRNQRFACFDLKNGIEKWRSKTFGKYASLIASGDKILALDQKGVLMLLKATPDSFQVMDKKTVGDDSWAHLAVRGNMVFVRDLNELIAFEFSK